MKYKMFPSGYKPFLQDILTKIQRTRYEMLMSVSKQTLLLYWDIGKMVSEKIELAGWGKSVVEQLAKDLQTYNRYSQLPEEYAKYLLSEEELDKRLSKFILE